MAADHPDQSAHTDPASGPASPPPTVSTPERLGAGPRAGVETVDEVAAEFRLPSPEATTPEAPGSGTAACPVLPGYEVLGMLGRGGMGVVYKARHLALDRVVALKLVRAGDDASAQERLRFRREVEAAARLQHPHIVQVFEVGEHEGFPYCALEFIDGGSLAEKLRGGPLPPAEAAGLVRALAEAVHLAHSRNVVHRDLKPANVLLTQTGTPKVADFGLARRLDDDSGVTQAGAVVGTPSYMAPEQAAGRGHEAGPAADVWALGAILYECLTGRPPFRGATVLETLEQVRAQEPPAPRSHNPLVPLDLETVCLRCLRKESESRYASAAEVAGELGRFLRGEPVRARPVGWPERAWKWARRNPGLAGAVTAAVGALLAGTILATLFGLDAKEQAKTANEERQAAVAARDELEGALARNWLIPLAVRPGPLTDAEDGALGQLAGFRGRPIVERFLAEALRDPRGPRRLRVRGSYALHAAVGLDLEKRASAERLLLRALVNPEAPEETRTDLALASAELGGLTLPSVTLVARTLVGAMSRAEDPVELRSLARGTRLVAPRLETEETAAAVAVLSPILGKTTRADTLQALGELLPVLAARLAPRDAVAALEQAMQNGAAPLPWQALGEGLAAAAARLEPRQAGDSLVRVMEKAPPLPVLANSLCAVATRMEPQQGAELLLRAMARTTNHGLSPVLAERLAALAERLEPAQASRICARAVSTLLPALPGQWVAEGLLALLPRLESLEAARFVEAVAQTAAKLTDPNAVYWIAELLSKGAERVKPPDAAEAAAALVAVIERANQSVALRALAEGLLRIADSLSPPDGAAVCERAAASLVQAAVRATDPAEFRFRAEGLSVLCTRLDRKRSEQLCAEAAEPVARALAGASTPQAARELAAALAVLAGRMAPEKAAETCSRAAAVLAAALRKAPDQDKGLLAEGIAKMAAVPGLREAIPVGAEAAALAQALDKPTKLLAPQGPARGLSVLAPAMDAGEAASVLVQALGKTTNPGAVFFLAEGLAATVRRLPPDQARRVSAEAAAAIVQTAETSTTRYGGEMQMLSRGLALVTPFAEPARAAPFLLRAVPRATDVLSTMQLMEALSEVASRLSPEEAPRIAAEMTSLLGRAITGAPDSSMIPFMMRGLLAVTGQMRPQEAARVESEVAASLLRAMHQSGNPSHCAALADSLTQAAARMEPREAARVCSQGADALVRALEQMPEQVPWPSRNGALARLAAHMEPRRAAELLARALARAGDSWANEELGRGLAAALTRTGAAEQTGAVAVLFVSAADPRGLPGVLPRLGVVTQPTPCHLTTAELVELLGQHLFVGPARRVVLDRLQIRHGQTFLDHWDFVRFAQDRNLGLDRASPPQHAGGDSREMKHRQENQAGDHAPR
jgi:hypothetical protein